MESLPRGVARIDTHTNTILLSSDWDIKMTSGRFFPGRVAVQQRVLPAYRVSFFDTLAAACQNGLTVLAGRPRPEESIATTDQLAVANHMPLRNWHVLNVNHPFYLCWQAGLIGSLEDLNPDVLIVEANPRYPSTRSAIRWMHARRRPVIGWGLGAPRLEGPLVNLRALMRRRFVLTFDGLIAYSQRGAQEYRSLGVPAEQVFVATNAVAPPPSRPPPARSPAFAGRPQILFVGRLQARKRIDLLLQACAALPANLQPDLTIIGDGPARTELEHLARQIYPRTAFPGPLYGTELADYHARADLFVLPGTGGLAVQEAMASGLPVVVARGDGTQEDLVRSGNGWLIPPDDPGALGVALQEALADPAALRRMGRESYRIVHDEININRMANVCIDALNAALIDYNSAEG